MRLFILLFAAIAWAADPTAAIRSKLSAGDLSSAAAILEDHRLANREDAGYWNGFSWLARGAATLGQDDKALQWARQIQQKASWTGPEWTTPLGAAIEVEAKVTGKTNRRAAAAYLKPLLERAKGHAIESRLWKNYNLLTLIGQDAPAVPGVKFDRPTVMFFWAHWCGDCKAQAAGLARVAKQHPELQWLAPTRTYADHPGVEAEEAKERESIDKAWAEIYAPTGIAAPIIDRASMIRYGVSSTPTFVMVDGRGKVRLYQPTRFTDAELEAAVTRLRN